jgi:small subunit ribosomal protein S20
MAKTSSAKKANRAGAKRAIFNARRKKTLRDTIKETSRAVLSGKAMDAAKAFPTLQQAIDKAAKTGVITKNAAARMKSRMAKRVSNAGKK